MISKSILTKPPSKNLMTRLKEQALEEAKNASTGQEEEGRRVDDVNTFKAEDYVHENVDQCEELANKLRPLLEGRKYIDNENGNLYEISRLYDYITKAYHILVKVEC